MAEKIYPEMLEGLKNETIIPYIKENFEFPCVTRLSGIRNWREPDDPEDLADSLVWWMAHNNWKSKRKAEEQLYLMSYVPFSDNGAIAALIDAYGEISADGVWGVNALDELDYRGVRYWCETYDTNGDVIEIINTSPDIEKELPAIMRLLDYDVDGFYSAMDAYRAGTPIEDLMA